MVLIKLSDPVVDKHAFKIFTFSLFIIYKETNCDTEAQNPLLVDFGFFYSVIFYTASASKDTLQNQNIFFLTEVSYNIQKSEKIEQKV